MKKNQTETARQKKARLTRERIERRTRRSAKAARKAANTPKKEGK